VNLPALLVGLLAAFPAGDALERAETLLREGKAAEARAVLEERLAAAPESSEKARLLEASARCFRAEGKPWEAEAAYGAALEIRPDWFEAALGRGETFLALSAESAGSDRPSAAEVRALAADARRWLGVASGIRPSDERARRGLARARLLDLDWAGAAEGIRALLAKSPGDGELLRMLAAALRGGGDRVAAAKAEGEAFAADPTLVDAAAARVDDLAAAGTIAEAREAAVESLRSDPSAEPVYVSLWRLDAAEKRYDALEDALARVLAKHPDHPRALHYLGYAQMGAGRKDAALETFRKKAALEPGNPGPRLQVARLLVAKAEYAAAEKLFEEAAAAKLEAGSVDQATVLEGLASIGVAHGQGRRFGEAERVFRRLAALEPRSPTYRMYLGLSLRRLGRYEEAEKEYLAAVDLSPFDGAPRNELGLLYLGWGRPDAARDAFIASAAEDPRITAPVENLASLARAAGRVDEALDRFRECHRRAVEFRNEEERLKYRRFLDVAAREKEAAAGGR
jgi:tetratricopeptide (TPR) repeat protein